MVSHNTKTRGQTFAQPYALRRSLQTSASLLVLLAMGAVNPANAQEETEQTGTIEEVLVSGQRLSIESAQAIKRNASQIVDSIVADDIGKLPDRSITETLQRVPGVTIERFMSANDPEHFSAEGSGVAVRGLTQVRSELNGRDSFAASGGRSLSFEDVPSELMAGVDVFKNPSADMIEGGLGGTVNLRTRMPFDADGQVVSVSASANYGDFIDEVNPSFSGLYSNRWDTNIGEIGLLANIAQSEISTRTDGIFSRPYFARTDLLEGQTAWVPEGADWRRMDFNRDRLGGYVGLQWRPSAAHEVSFQVFRSEYDMQWDEDAIFVNNDQWNLQVSDDAQFDENGVFRSGRLTDASGGIPFGADIRAATRESLTTDYSLNYKWLPNDQWEVSTDLQYTKSGSDALDTTLATGIDIPYMDVDLTGARPAIGTDEEYLADYSNYYWAFTMPHLEDNNAEQIAWRADVRYNFEDAGLLTSVKAGVRLTDREADNIDTGYHWVAVYQPYMLGWALDSEIGMPYINSDANLNLNEFDDFFRGDANLTGVVWAPSVDLALGYPETFSDLHNNAAERAIAEGHVSYGDAVSIPYEPRNITEPAWNNIQEEQTSAIYALADFAVDNWRIPVDGNIGVRVVRTESTAEGHVVYPEVDYFAAETEEVSVDNSYTHVLPNLNLRFTLLEDLYLRFAASQAISRPQFNQLQAYTLLSANLPSDITPPEGELAPREDYELTVSSGTNPNLEPMEANQMDLSLEWYFSEAGSAHLNLFWKDIEGFIRDQTFTENYGGDEYVVTRPTNIGTAEMQGFEVGYSQFFDFLPSPFDGLGIQTNYTYIDSSTDVPTGTAPVDTDGSEYGDLPYEGLSENAFNFNVMYEKGRVSARLAWSWRDEYLMSVGPNGFNGEDGGIDANQSIVYSLPVYSDDTGQLDGSIFYDLTDNVSVGLEANNLTNAETRTFVRQTGAGDNYASYFVNDTRWALTVRATY